MRWYLSEIDVFGALCMLGFTAADKAGSVSDLEILEKADAICSASKKLFCFGLFEGYKWNMMELQLNQLE